MFRFGDIRIQSGTGLLRTIKWDGVQRSIAIKASPSRDNLTDVLATQGNWTGYDFPVHKGVYKCYYSEESINFENSAQALSVIYNPEDKYFPMVYTSDGIVVGWSTATSYHGIQIVVWQVLIDGKIPHDLPGACSKADLYFEPAIQSAVK